MQEQQIAAFADDRRAWTPAPQPMDDDDDDAQNMLGADSSPWEGLKFTPHNELCHLIETFLYRADI